MRNIRRFKGTHRFLSNFHNNPIFFREQIYPTAEHLFQALKTRDSEMREKVRQTANPVKAKRMGRRVPLRMNWEEVKDRIMLLVVRLKFLQNPKLEEKLFNTGKRTLTEGNYRHDNYWGDCFCPKCHQTKGRNQLGKTLMRIRNYLQEEDD